MISYLNTTSSQLTVFGDFQGTTFWVNTESASSGAFAYLLGAGFRFNLGNHFCILTNLDYLGANREFVDVGYSSSVIDYSTDTCQQKFGMAKKALGTGWMWWK